LVAWILSEVGKNEEWLKEQLGIKALTKDNKLTAYPKSWNRSIERLGECGKYRALGNNCNNFTLQALDVYVGYRWIRGATEPRDLSGDFSDQLASTSLKSVVNAWDFAVEVGQKGKPRKSAHRPIGGHIK
jgi:hypothetical protein